MRFRQRDSEQTALQLFKLNGMKNPPWWFLGEFRSRTHFSILAPPLDRALCRVAFPFIYPTFTSFKFQGEPFCSCGLQFFMTQGLRKSLGQRSKSLGSFVWVLPPGPIENTDQLVLHSLNLPTTPGPAPVPQSIYYCFQLISGSHEIIGWENDGECLQGW